MAFEEIVVESTSKATLATDVAAKRNDAQPWAIVGYSTCYDGTNVKYSCLMERQPNLGLSPLAWAGKSKKKAKKKKKRK